MLNLKKVLFATLLITGFINTTFAQENEQIFVEELNKLKLLDYSEYYLTKLIKTNPENKDLLKGLLAQIYVLQKKYDEGSTLLNEVKGDSKYWLNAKLAYSQACFKRKKLDLAIKNCNDIIENARSFIATGSEIEKGSNREIVTKTAVMYLKAIYEHQMKPDKVDQTVNLLTELFPETIDVRVGLLIKLMAKIDTAEKMKANGEPGWEISLNKVLTQEVKEDPNKPKRTDYKNNKLYKKASAIYTREKMQNIVKDEELPSLGSLRWKGRDSITASSYVQAGRALFLLEKYDEAIVEMKQDLELLQGIDDIYIEANDAGGSPMATYREIIGNILYIKSKTMTGRAKAKYMTAALKKYFIPVLTKNYGYKKNFDIYTLALKIQAELEELGVDKIAFPKDFREPVRKKQIATIVPGPLSADVKGGKFEESIPKLLAIFQEKKNMEGSIEALDLLLASYLGLAINGDDDHYWEILAITKYIRDFYNKDPRTPMLLLKTAKAMQDSKRAGGADAATYIYEIYLKIAANHQYAPDIAYKLAQNDYKTAKALAQESIAISEKEAKLLKQDEAYAQYQKAIEKLMWIGQNFANSPKVISSYYLLGTCHKSKNEYDLSSKNYLLYCDNENDKKKLTKIGNAKLTAGSVLFKKGQALKKEAKKIKTDNLEEDDKIRKAAYLKADKIKSDATNVFKEALKHFIELQSWISSNGKLNSVMKDPKTLKIKKSLDELIGFAYSEAGNKEEACKAFGNYKEMYKGDDPKKKIPTIMLKWGSVLVEMKKMTEASKVLDELSFEYPESREGKEASFILVKTLYDIEAYEQCITEVQKMLNTQAKDLPIYKLRWIAEYIMKCGEATNKECGKVALKASKILLDRIKTPEHIDWMGESSYLANKANKKELDRIMKTIREKLLYDAGNSALLAEQDKDALKYLTELLKNKRTPYLYDALFKRAEVYLKGKMYNNARKDLATVNANASAIRNLANSAKAKYLMAETYELEKNYKKAYKSYFSVAMSVIQKNNIDMSLLKKPTSSKEMLKEKERWIEKAVYKCAVTAKKANLKLEMINAVKGYNKKYTETGKYSEEINKIIIK